MTHNKKNKIKELLTKGKLPDAIKALLNLELDSKTEVIVRTYSAKFNKLQQDFNLGLISFEDKKRTQSQITFGLIEITEKCDSLSENELWVENKKLSLIGVTGIILLAAVISFIAFSAIYVIPSPINTSGKNVVNEIIESDKSVISKGTKKVETNDLTNPINRNEISTKIHNTYKKIKDQSNDIDRKEDNTIKDQINKNEIEESTEITEQSKVKETKPKFGLSEKKSGNEQTVQTPKEKDNSKGELLQSQVSKSNDAAKSIKPIESKTNIPRKNNPSVTGSLLSESASNSLNAIDKSETSTLTAMELPIKLNNSSKCDVPVYVKPPRTSNPYKKPTTSKKASQTGRTEYPKTYTLELWVNSSLSKADIFVDGSRARLLKDNLNIKVIEVFAKNENHLIELKTDESICEESVFIKKDTILNLTCN